MTTTTDSDTAKVVIKVGDRSALELIVHPDERDFVLSLIRDHGDRIAEDTEQALDMLKESRYAG
jgi:hypothetical protein